MSVKASVPGEDLCASTPLISFTSDHVLCNVLEYDVSQVLILFIYFPTNLISVDKNVRW